MPARQLLKTIHVGAPWGAEVKIERVPYRGGRHSAIALDYLFEVSATWTGPNLRGETVDPRGISVRDSAMARNYQIALAAAQMAAARLRSGEVPNLPELLPASRLTILG